jgi:hypothetical protein
MPKTISIQLKAELVINDGESEFTVTMDLDALTDHIAACQAVAEAMQLGEEEAQ